MDQQQQAGGRPAQPNHPNDEVSATLSDIAQAFEAWENGFRADPTKFMTADECAAAQVSAMSASRAAHFWQLLLAIPSVDVYPNLLKDDPDSRRAYYQSRCNWGNSRGPADRDTPFNAER